MRQVVKNKKLEKRMFVILWIISICLLIYKLIEIYLDSEAARKIRQELTYVYEQVKYETPEVQKNTKIQKLKELQEMNSDIIALIEIKGTNINYPVVQTNNNSYYMTRNYKKEKSRDGALFLDKDYDFKKPSTNLLIYGHNNIGSLEMFAQLIKYKKEDFFKEHHTINFITHEEEAQFEIISVFLSRVYYKEEKNVFRYYSFIDADNEAEFNRYVNNVKRLSLYDIKTTAEYGDQLMTLSTCEYSQINGRFVVVARKIMSD